jgi:hypothetical protein
MRAVSGDYVHSSGNFISRPGNDFFDPLTGIVISTTPLGFNHDTAFHALRRS